MTYAVFCNDNFHIFKIELIQFFHRNTSDTGCKYPWKHGETTLYSNTMNVLVSGGISMIIAVIMVKFVNDIDDKRR